MAVESDKILAKKKKLAERVEIFFTHPAIIPQAVLAFDYGTKKIGVAFAQKITRRAIPLATVSVQNVTELWKKIQHLMDEWRPEVLLVGWPGLEGQTNLQLCTAIVDYADELTNQFKRPVFMVDESFSSQAAHSWLREQDPPRRSEMITKDSIAACLILEAWYYEIDRP